MNNRTNWTPWMLLAILLGCIYFYYTYNQNSQEIRSLRLANEKLEIQIQRHELKADSLALSSKLKDRQVDSVLIALDDSKQAFNLTLDNYDKLKKDFKSKPIAVRDSIILAYIRANQ